MWKYSYVKSQEPTVGYASHRVLLNTIKNVIPEDFSNKMRNHQTKYFENI